ncbi:MAG TPA: hypothetical protein VGC70_07755, partial [Burkholderiales bacterium]
KNMLCVSFLRASPGHGALKTRPDCDECMTLWMNHIGNKKTSAVSDPLFNRYFFPASADFQRAWPVLPASEER